MNVYRARKLLSGSIEHMPKKKRGASMAQTLREHAQGVMAVLGKGHSERVYHRAMITSLNRRLVPHRSEVIAPIFFMGEVVGFGRCDMLIGKLVVEFKANMRCPSKTSPQMQKYLESLRATGKRTHGLKGLVVNFNQRTGRVEMHHERLTKANKAKGRG